MTPDAVSTKAGENFAVAKIGRFSDLKQFTFEAPEAPMKLEGKIFLKQLLNLSSAEISFNNLPPSTEIPFYHKHRFNEEIYLFVQGQGEFQVDGCMFSVAEGTAVRVDPEGERCLRNTSETEDLCWIVVQSRVGSHPEQTVQDGLGVDKSVSWVGKQQI